MSQLESLESRTLFAATASASPASAPLLDELAVVDRVTAVQVDRAAVEVARRECAAAIELGRQRLASIIETGAATLAADRAQLKAARGDAAATSAAREQLKADRARVRAELAAARAEVAGDSAGCRAALKAAASSLAAGVRQLRADLRGGTPAQRQSVQKLANDLSAIQAGSDVRPEQIRDLVTDVRAAFEAAGPGLGALPLLDTLFTGARDAFADGEFTPDEQATLTATLQGVLAGTSVPPELSAEIVTGLRDFVDAANIDAADAPLILSDVVAVANAFFDAPAEE